MVKKLENLNFEILNSKANFIFVKHKEFSGKYLYEKLKENGVLVRHFNKERIEDYLRITIGTDEEMSLLIANVKKILKY